MTKFNRRIYITPDTWKMITVRLILPRFVCVIHVYFAVYPSVSVHQRVELYG